VPEIVPSSGRLGDLLTEAVVGVAGNDAVR
jgi:hypothetical protein